MPVDKFGRHLYRHREPDDSNVRFVETVSGLYYDAILRFVAVERLDSGDYKLLSDSSEYSIPAFDGGIITSVHLRPTEVNVFINGEQYATKNMIGKHLRLGDVIQFKYPPPIPLLISPLFAEISLQVPIAVKPYKSG